MRMNIRFDTSPRELAETISDSFNMEEVFELITELDLLQQEYSFTERLRDHFIEEIRKEDEIGDVQ